MRRAKGKRSLGRPRSRWQDLKETDGTSWTDLIWLRMWENRGIL